MRRRMPEHPGWFTRTNKTPLLFLGGDDAEAKAEASGVVDSRCDKNVIFL
jgi:hypothetical protein